MCSSATAPSASPASGGVAEPSPAFAGGFSSYIHFALHIKCMAEREGFEPSIPF